jgi:hypothetical protein
METISRRRAVCRGRAALLWALGLFAASQGALSAWLHRTHPEMCDSTWQFRLARLKARLAEAPGRPLVLVLGSSRPANALSPTDLGDCRPRGRPAPLVFNLAMLGAGPVRELLSLRRVLAEGIRPEWVLVEAWPAFWGQEGPYCEEHSIQRFDFYWSDLSVLAHLYDRGWDGFARVCAETLAVVHNRTAVLNQYLPFLVSRATDGEVRSAQMHWQNLDDWGWLPTRMPQAPPEYWQWGLKKTRDVTRPTLEKLQVTPLVDWTFRTLLEECRRRRIKAAFVVLPEHSSLRSWYTPHTHAVFNGYLLRLQNEYGTPVIDARDWVPDSEFVDFAHVQDRGARTFSTRFGREALRPLLEGSPLPASARLCGAAVPVETAEHCGTELTPDAAGDGGERVVRPPWARSSH